MGLVEIRLMTTHLDKHGERFSLEALESFKMQIESNIIPHGIDHDPRIEPVGRLLTAKIVKLDDGEYALDGISEIFNDLTNIEEITDRELVLHEYSNDSLEIRSDRSYSSEDDTKIINEISELMKCSKPPQKEVKKALDPLSIFWICGAFVIGGITNGFLNKLGSEAFDLLKSKLNKLLSKRNEDKSEKLFAFDFTITDKKCNVEVILTNPSEKDIELVLHKGLQELDRILPTYLMSPLKRPIRNIVFEFKDGDLQFKFAVRNDGIPLKMKSGKSKW
jgi:hypothetical protein